MISKIKVSNFGPLARLDWNPGMLNVIIGENGTGKTLLLKLLYSIVRTREEFKRGNDKRNLRNVLDEKLIWTFQPDKLSDLVTKRKKACKISCTVDNRKFEFSFGTSAEKGVGEVADSQPRDALSIFFPAKEVLSISHIVRHSRDIMKEFGFDDTYLDLINALEAEPTKGRNYESFSSSRRALGDLLGGKLVRDEGAWIFKKGNERYPISLTAEGIRRIAIIDRLLGNRTLSMKSILFIDEPEAVLHPNAINVFIDMLTELGRAGMQIFMATHSYLVLKKLQLNAQQDKLATPVLSFVNEGHEAHDLRDGMPDNPIVEASLKIYSEEIDLGL